MDYLEQIIVWAGAGLASAVGAIVAVLSAFMRIKKAVTQLKTATASYDEKAEALTALSSAAADLVGVMQHSVETVTAAYNKQAIALATLQAENEQLRQDNEAIKQALVLLSGGTAALVGNGTAKEIKRLFVRQNTQTIVMDEVKP